MSSARTHELIRKYLDGAATPEEMAELEQVLVAGPEAANAFAAASRLDAGLTVLFQEQRGLVETTALLEQVQRRRGAVGRRLAWAGVGTLVAAVVLLTVTVLLERRASEPPPPAVGPRVVAGVVWVAGRPTQAPPEGVPFDVVGAGPVEVQLADGSSVLLTPTTRAVLHGRVGPLEQLVELLAGGGTFQVRPGAGPFQVETSQGRVTVLGTEFTVRLPPATSQGEPLMTARDAVLTVAVLTGLVQVEFGGQTYLLGAGESRLFAADEPEKPKVKPLLRRGTVTAVEAEKITITSGGDKVKEGLFVLAVDVKVTVDGKPAKVADLVKGMLVEVEQKEPKGPVIAVKAEGPSVGGVLKAVGKDTITLAGAGKEGQTAADRTLPVGSGAKVVVEGKKSGELADLKPGVAVSVRLSADGKTVLAVLQGGKTEKGGEKKPGAVLQGVVQSVDTAARQVTVGIGKGAPEQRKVEIAADAKISIDGKPGELADVKPEQRVSLKLSEDGKKAIALAVVSKKVKPEK